MKVLLTGGTGFIGSAVLRDLLANGHSVTAVVRSEDSAAKVRDAGATPVVGDLTDTAWLKAQLDDVDGAIHTASPSDTTSPAFDRAIATTVAEAWAGTGKPYLHTGGVWVYGDGDAITEDDTYAPPAITAWRGEVEQIVLDADTRTVLVVPAVVYGNGSGIPFAAIASAPRTDDGRLHLVGDGDQHWTTVHVDDVADLYVRALESDSAAGRYLAVAGEQPTVRELGEAFARGAGLAGVTPEDKDATRARLSGPFADALFLDQRVSTTRAQDELGWKPAAPALVTELESGSYQG